MPTRVPPELEQTSVLDREPPVGPAPGGGPEPPRGDRFGWGMLVGALLLLALAGGGLALWFATRDGETGSPATSAAATTGPAQTAPAAPGEVFVPDVTGLKQEEAGARLGRAGLEPTTRRRATDRPTGTVISQAPKAGAQVKRGSQVRILVDEGAPAAAVPDLIGESEAAATAALKQAGFESTTTEASSGAAAGTVVAQNPSAGSKAKPGSVVTLSIAAGGAATTSGTTTATPGSTTTSPQPPQPRTATVPDLTGRKLADAAQTLGQAGIYPNVVYIPSDEGIGTVLEQSKPAGTDVARGTYVRINVARGADPGPPTAVPDVRGQTRADAIEALAGAGFEVKVLERPLPAAKPNDTVVDEQPSRGTKIPRGALVILLVGRHQQG